VLSRRLIDAPQADGGAAPSPVAPDPDAERPAPAVADRAPIVIPIVAGAGSRAGAAVGQLLAASPPPAETPSAQASTPVDAVLAALAPLAALWWLLALRDVDLREIGDLGIIGVLPVVAVPALAVLAAGFALATVRGRPWVSYVYVVALVVALYGVLVPIEEVPWYNVSWRHAGVADTIARTGEVDPRIDAYFNWPGFFTALAATASFAGVSPLVLASWAPVVLNLLLLPPLAVIASRTTEDPRVVPLALWTFALTNWVAQDYLSPQAIAFVLYLVVLAVLLAWFGTHGPVRRPATARVAAAAVVLGSAAAVVASHQLTPSAVLLTTAGLVAFRLTTMRTLPLIVGIAAIGWLVVVAVPYLAGNIDDLRAQLGNFSENIRSSLGDRVGGSSGHEAVVRSRLLFTGAVWGAALAAAIVRLRAGRRVGALAVLGAAPLALPVLQPYGGEILLRVYLFTLPAVVVLIASGLLAAGGASDARRARLALVVLATTTVLLPSVVFVRGGNARQWLFTRDEAAAVDRLYDHAAPGSVLLASSPNLPWQHRRYADLEHLVLVRQERQRGMALADDVASLLVSRGKGAPGYVVVTRGTLVYDELFGVDDTWGSARDLGAALDRSPRFRRVLTSRDATVWRLWRRQ
jgi:hypothetical protein